MHGGRTEQHHADASRACKTGSAAPPHPACGATVVPGQLLLLLCGLAPRLWCILQNPRSAEILRDAVSWDECPGVARAW